MFMRIEYKPGERKNDRAFIFIIKQYFINGIFKDELIIWLDYLEKNNEFEAQRRKRYEAELIEIIRKRLMNFIFDESTFKGKVELLIDQISKKEVDPYTAADEILGKILK